METKKIYSFEEESLDMNNCLRDALNENWEELHNSPWSHYGIKQVCFKNKKEDLVVTYDLNLDTKPGMTDWYRKKTKSGIFLIHTDNRFDYYGNWIPNKNIVEVYKTLNGIVKNTNK